ncbi:hypothetical protein [uncultured Ruminococcus sp.]|uniref:hypothetical protein n=1 Tax=uncultured Ruminococcus sp. TaxID=165186 RepID=UPI0025870E33|nr:hypothetical protein [uncultured Ruminococcus sp.]
MQACIARETLNKARLTALYAICLQIFRHIAQKSLAIRQYACEISMQSAEKSDYASYAQALFSVSLGSPLGHPKGVPCAELSPQVTEGLLSTAIKRFHKELRFFFSLLKRKKEAKKEKSSLTLDEKGSASHGWHSLYIFTSVR